MMVLGFILLAISMVLASLPNIIFLKATSRSFMASVCVQNPPPTPSPINGLDYTGHYCPNDTATKALVAAGVISGHPDFERRVDPFLFTAASGATMQYQAPFAIPGVNFPRTNPGGVNPYVLSQLQYDTTGIGKMQYCPGNVEGYVCDVGLSPRTVFNATSFSTWYQDSLKFNRRVGFNQKLFLNKADNTYNYSSATKGQDPTGDGFYDPISENGLLNKVWPRAVVEIVSQRQRNYSTGKYWFTTEIHSSFQYTGGESFSFSGDDDVHVFINRRIAINLGGEHGALPVTITLDNFTRELNITRGQIYEFDMFHAERQTLGSNFALETTLSEACNVVNSDFRSNGDDVVLGIDWKSDGTGITADGDWIMLGGPGFGTISNNIAQLMTGGIKNVASYMFHKHQHNLGTGFLFSFNFKMTGIGHGFSVLFHNRKLGLKNLNGGSGPNLGIKNTDNSFAIVFDSCPDFPSCPLNRQEIRMHYSIGGLNSVQPSTRTKFDPNVVQDWRDGEWHKTEIFYYETPDWLEVYVDDSLRLVERNFSMKSVVNGRNAFVGFSSSSSETSTLNASISNVTIKTVKVTPRFTLLSDSLDSFPKQMTANGRDKSTITIQTRDACRNLIGFGGFDDQVQGILVADSPGQTGSSGRRLAGENENDTLIIVGSPIDQENGQYAVEFKSTITTNFTAHIAFGNCSWNGTTFISSKDCFVFSKTNAVQALPFDTPAPTSFVPSEELPPAAIAGIGVAFGILGACGSIALFIGIRIRNRWRRDKKFVEAGRLAALEKNMEYEGDTELDRIQNKLQSTLHQLQAERAKNLKNLDQQSIIDDLNRQKGELQEIVRRMKIQKAGGDPDAGLENSNVGIGTRLRKSFAPSKNAMSARLSRGFSVTNPATVEHSTSNPLFGRFSRKTIRKSTTANQIGISNEEALKIPPPPDF